MNRQTKKLSMGHGNCNHCRKHMTGGANSYKKFIKTKINRITRLEYKYALQNTVKALNFFKEDHDVG